MKDLAGAKALYAAALGVEPNMDGPHYVNFSVDGLEVGLDPHGHSKGLTGPVAYWHVDDIEQNLRTLLDAGAAAVQEAEDVGGASWSRP